MYTHWGLQNKTKYNDDFISNQIIPMLTDPASHGGQKEDAFEVIVPSIPGYGFSESPKKKGIICVLLYIILKSFSFYV